MPADENSLNGKRFGATWPIQKLHTRGIGQSHALVFIILLRPSGDNGTDVLKFLIRKHLVAVSCGRLRCYFLGRDAGGTTPLLR